MVLWEETTLEGTHRLIVGLHGALQTFPDAGQMLSEHADAIVEILT